MICAWKELLGILPPWLALEVDRSKQEKLQELRLRINAAPELVYASGNWYLNRKISREDLNHCVNLASRYSPWAAQSVSRGYITAPGGHRIGLCGDAVIKEGEIIGIKNLRSLCIRVARDFPGIGLNAAKYTGSILLLGPPGSGKTTLLRDMIRQIANRETVAVVDEREELFPEYFPPGKCMDILTGCEKAVGIGMLLRTMGPSCIAVDEITAEEDTEALIHAGWCGVRLLATAHAASVKDLIARPIYHRLASSKLFDHILVLHRDKSWREERMDL